VDGSLCRGNPLEPRNSPESPLLAPVIGTSYFARTILTTLVPARERRRAK
jgi:hypothetical protein